MLGVSLPDPQGEEFPSFSQQQAQQVGAAPLSPVMRSPSKWAVIATISTTAFLSGLSLPTTANNAKSGTSSPAWISPLPGERPILTAFNPQGKRGSGAPPSTHMGVDFLATFGEEIRAPMGGLITFAGTVNEIPIVVLTHHDQLVLRRTTYLPATTDLPIGYPVMQGTNFARVAPIFHCARPCLHWGERIGKRYANPMKHLGRAALLPRFS